MITGMNGGTGVSVSIPSRLPAAPPSATRATTPYAAPTERRFITPALSAITGARKAARSSRNDRPTTTAMNSGRRVATCSL
jgi:hypothetical protein